MDTALPDESVHFEDFKEGPEDHASDNELTIAEESSGEEDMVLTDNDDFDSEMVCVCIAVAIIYKVLSNIREGF